MSRSRLLLLTILAAAAAFRGFRADDPFGGRIHDWNEAFYALSARHGFDHGIWTPRSWGEDPQPVHWVTPGFVWTLHGAFRILGTGEAQARSVSILCAVIAVWATFRLGRRLFGERTGILAAAILAVNNMHVIYGRNVQTDSMLVMFCMLSLDAFAAWIERPGSRRLAVACLFCSLAFLTKQTAILLVPAFAVTAALAGLPRRRVAAATLAVAAATPLLALPWIVDHWIARPALFLSQFHGDALRAPPFTAASFLDFYGRTFAPPLWPFVLLGTVLCLRGRAETGTPRSLPLVWTALVFVAILFAHPGGHRYYVLPMVPTLAIVAAAFLDGTVRPALARRRLPRGAWGGLVALLLLTEGGFAGYRLVRNKYGWDELPRLAAAIETRHPDAPPRLLVTPDLVGPVGWYYLERVRPARVRIDLDPPAWDTVLAAAVPGADVAFVIEYGKNGTIPEGVRSVLDDGITIRRTRYLLPYRRIEEPVYRLYRVVPIESR